MWDLAMIALNKYPIEHVVNGHINSSYLQDYIIICLRD